MINVHFISLIDTGGGGGTLVQTINELSPFPLVNLKFMFVVYLQDSEKYILYSIACVSSYRMTLTDNTISTMNSTCT